MPRPLTQHEREQLIELGEEFTEAGKIPTVFDLMAFLDEYYKTHPMKGHRMKMQLFGMCEKMGKEHPLIYPKPY